MLQCPDDNWSPLPLIRRLKVRSVLRSKIHKATITEANPEYVGSITIGVLNERVEELKREMIRDGDRKRLTEKIWAAVGDDQLRKDDPDNHVKHDQSYWRDD